MYIMYYAKISLIGIYVSLNIYSLFVLEVYSAVNYFKIYNEFPPSHS